MLPYALAQNACNHGIGRTWRNWWELVELQLILYLASDLEILDCEDFGTGGPSFMAPPSLSSAALAS